MNEVNEVLDCHAAMRRLWEYLDGELSEQTLEAIHAHLSTCADCYRHYDFEREFLAALEAVQAQDCAPSTLHSRVLDTLRMEGFVPRYGER
jgi:anti-sigma factor (TIGR02949 family)